MAQDKTTFFAMSFFYIVNLLIKLKLNKTKYLKGLRDLSARKKEAHGDEEIRRQT